MVVQKSIDFFSSGASDNEGEDASKGATAGNSKPAKIEANQSEVIKIEEIKTENPKPKRHISKLIQHKIFELEYLT